MPEPRAPGDALKARPRERAKDLALDAMDWILRALALPGAWLQRRFRSRPQ